MLVRLEHALDCPELAKQMLLVPKAAYPSSSGDINLVVGYNGSARSQTALDLTLWIAHQTRLTTQRIVTVQVVYVVDSDGDRSSQPNALVDFCPSPGSRSDRAHWVDHYSRDRWEPMEVACGQVATRSTSITCDGSDLALPVFQVSEQRHALDDQIEQFEKADRILWQARHLADEWRGSLETHLRFGNLVEELRAVATQVSTTALMLGCSSVDDPLVQALGQNLPFPILGIPSKITVC